jgi:hypothetical protein
MTIPVIPPLPDPHVVEFEENVMIPPWRDFWTKLLISVNASITTLTTLGTTVTALSASEAALLAAFNKAILAPCLVSALPDPTLNTNVRGMATDSTQTTTAGIGQIVAGGGGNFVPVFSDSLVWRIG